VCVCVCTHMCVCVCVCVCVSTHALDNISIMNMYIHTHKDICTMCMYIHMHIHLHCIFLNIHPHTHTNTQPTARAQQGTHTHNVYTQQAALNHALDIMKRDRKWNDDGGRKLALQFFESLGGQHPDVIEARKRLSTLLFIWHRCRGCGVVCCVVESFLPDVIHASEACTRDLIGLGWYDTYLQRIWQVSSEDMTGVFRGYDRYF